MPIMTKICSCPTCAAKGKPQPMGAFGFNKSSPDGHHWYCRNCNNAKQRAWKMANREKVRAAKRDYDKRHRNAKKGPHTGDQLELDL